MKVNLFSRLTIGSLVLGAVIGFSLPDPAWNRVMGEDGEVDLSQVEDLNLPEAVPPIDEKMAPPEAEEEKSSDADSGGDANLPPAETSDPPGEPSSGHPFLDLVRAGGWIGAVIFLLSLGACAVAIRLFWILRRPILLPPTLTAEFGAAIEKGRIQAAAESCRRYPSFLAAILAGGLRNIDGGWEDVEKGLEETLASETARLYRKADFLMVVGNIAPMLGLLGTVLGMVAAFGELAASDGLGRFANLAQGIYFALVTTVDGLLAAIPALALFAFFNHRIAGFSADAAERAEQLMTPVKRYFQTLKKDALPIPPTISSADRSRGAAARPVNPPHAAARRPAAPPLPPAISVTNPKTPARKRPDDEDRFFERDDAE